MSHLRDRFTPWTQPDPAVRERFTSHPDTCAACEAGADCPTYDGLLAAWRSELARAKRCPAAVADRQLQRLGVDPATFRSWRAARALPAFESLPLPDQERICWWLLRRGPPT